MADVGTHLHVIQPVLTFLDPFLPECGGRDVDAAESESSPILVSSLPHASSDLAFLVSFASCLPCPRLLLASTWRAWAGVG